MNDGRFTDGMKAALPIVLGYVPVGMAFGLLARKAGLSTLDVTLMSLLVYAGASQFLAIEMILKGMAWFPIVMAAFFLNLRHLLMSSNLSLFLEKARLSSLGLLSAQLTDESYVVAVSRLPEVKNKPRYLFGLQMTSHMAWVGGSVAGALFGPFVKSSDYGLPYALPALFICLLVLQIRSIRYLSIMVLAGASSLFFKWAFPGNWNILFAALLSSGAGLAIEMARGKKVIDEK